jgi:hypothetical protein
MTFRLVRRTELSLGGRQCKKDYKPGVGTPAIMLDIRDVGRALKSVGLEMMKLLENATGTSTYSGWAFARKLYNAGAGLHLLLSP